MGPIRKIVSFLLVTVALYIGLVFLLSRVSLGTYPLIYGLSDGLNLKGGNSHQKFEEFDSNEKYDVVVLGSSHAYRGYDPTIFAAEGYKAFNLGSSSQTPFNSYFLIDEYVTKDNCGLLLLDVFNVALEMEALESSSDLIQNISSDGAAGAMAFAMRDPRALNMFTLRMLNKDVGPYYTDTAYIASGFSENRTMAPDSTEYGTACCWNPNVVQVKYLKRIIQLCEKRGVSLLLVNHPAPEEQRGEGLRSVNRFLQNLSEDQGVVYLDFSSLSGMDSRMHFYDHTHLNQNGVEKFNRELISHLRAEGFL